MSTIPTGRRGPQIRLNRNLMNHPIARDVRVRIDWDPSANGRSVWATMPGDETVALRLPADAAEEVRRWPSAADMAVLFAVLAKANDRGDAAFPNMAAVAKAAGLVPGKRSCATIRAAIEFWEIARLRFEKWYEPKEGHIKRTLPPPIEASERDGRRLRIRLDRDWMKMGDGYYVPVGLPLPRSAQAQNLTAFILTMRRDEENTEIKITRRMRQSELCRKIGLRANSRNNRLPGYLEAAKSYFAGLGGELMPVQKDGLINFTIDDPKLPPPKKRPAPVPARPGERRPRSSGRGTDRREDREEADRLAVRERQEIAIAERVRKQREEQETSRRRRRESEERGERFREEHGGLSPMEWRRKVEAETPGGRWEEE